jgi:hypothetical protein
LGGVINPTQQKDTTMNAMSYQLKYMHEDAENIESLFAVTITNQDGKKVPTVIMVADTLSEERQEEMRKRLWEIADILRSANIED